MENPELLIALVVTLALLIRSSLGFGDAIVAVPLLGFFTDIKLGVPVLTATAAVFSLIMGVIEFKHINWRQMAVIIIACFIGIPFGVYGLKALDEILVLFLLGSLLVGFSLFSILVNIDEKTISPSWGGAFGFMGGVLGGAFNMIGLPVAIFGRLQQWKPSQFRVLMATFFLPTCLVTAFGHYFAGLWTAQFYTSFSYAILPSIAMIFVGKWVNSKISPERFNKIILYGVLILGIVLIVEHGHHLLENNTL